MWRRLNASGLMRSRLVVALITLTYVLFFIYFRLRDGSSSSSSFTLTQLLNTRQRLLELVKRGVTEANLLAQNSSDSGVDAGQPRHLPQGHSGQPAGSTHVLLQTEKTVNVKEAMQPVKELRAADSLVGQPSTLPPQQEFPFRYLINEPGVCHPEVAIINMIPVSPDRISVRLMIRDVWGNQQFRVVTKMRTVFVVGTTSSDYYQRQLEAESHSYHDIIQIDFTDSYSNLTLKTLSMLHWTQTFCQSAKWILKTDDDVFVNPFALNNLLQQYPNSTFVCRMNLNLKVCRIGGECLEKWAVSYKEYAEDYYPPYCDGPAYAIAASMARRIFAAANKTHPHIMEDAYFTGVMARTFQPKYQNVPRARFPRKARKVIERLWNGSAIFMQYLEKKKGVSRALWKEILRYNNISISSLTS